MVITIRKRAIVALQSAAAYVETVNTPGSGERWLDKVKEEIYTLARSKAKLALCKHPSLAKHRYRCYTYHNWIIAFRTSKNKFEVCRFVWGKRLA